MAIDWATDPEFLAFVANSGDVDEIEAGSAPVKLELLKLQFLADRRRAAASAEMDAVLARIEGALGSGESSSAVVSLVKSYGELGREVEFWYQTFANLSGLWAFEGMYEDVLVEFEAEELVGVDAEVAWSEFDPMGLVEWESSVKGFLEEKEVARYLELIGLFVSMVRQEVVFNSVSGRGVELTESQKAEGRAIVEIYERLSAFAKAHKESVEKKARLN
jgi:hypothetical protein